MVKRCLVGLLAPVLLSLGLAAPAWAQTEWRCSEWQPDPEGRCEEVRTCTRTLCDVGERLENCRTETKRECANPVEPRPEGSRPRAPR